VQLWTFRLVRKKRRQIPRSAIQPIFVNQLAFLARMLQFIPHRAILCFAARLDRRRKRGNGKGGYTTNHSRHQFHLRALELPKVTLRRPALLTLQCIPSSIPRSFGTECQFNEQTAAA